MDSIARPMLRHIVGASLLAVCASSQATNYSWTIGNYSFLPNPITMSDSVTADAGGDKNFSGISLVNDGAILWNPSERLGFVSSSLTNNNVVDLRGDANLTYVGGAASTFINNATFQKSVAFGTTTIGSGISFTNNGGIIRAAAGTIDFASGSATFNVGTQFTGAGVNRVSSSASFNGAFTSDNLVLTGGNFTGSGASIGGAVLWTGGQLVGNWTVGSGHTLHVQSDIDKNFSGVAFTNFGAVNWQTSERAGFVSSAVTNHGLFDLKNDANLTYAGGGASSFTNAATGIFRKSGGAGASVIGSGVSFINDGGVINAAAGTIEFAGGSATFNANTQFTGAGVNRVSNNASFNGAFTSANLVLSGGNFTGGSASISGPVEWTGGQFVGTWTLATGHTLYARTGSEKNFFGTTFVNDGTLNWQTANRVGFVSSAFVNNGTFNLEADANLTYIGGSASSFTNNLTFLKSAGTGTTTIGSSIGFVNNGGTIQADTGTIDFAGGSATFNAGTQFSGAGVNRVSNHASFNGAFTSANLVLDGGNYTGGAAVIGGTVTWTGGQFVGGWTLASGQTLNAQSGIDKNLSGTAFVNSGTLNWNTTDRIGFVSSSFTNNGIFDLKADANLTYIGGSASSFTNNAMFRKSAGAGTTTVGSAINFINNGGTIQADTGTIDFAGGSATFNAGTQFSGAGVNRVSNHASFNGAFTSANLVLDGGNYTGSAAVIGGTVTWTGGQFVGGWTLATGQTLNAQSGIDKNFFGTTFVNNGTLNWNTTERVGFVSSSVVNNGIFDLKADANLTYIGGSASSFTNNAMFRKSAGAGTTTVGSAINFINNGGTIQADTGTINFAGGSATFNANTQFTGAGVNRLSNHASFNGAFTSANLVLEGGNFTGTAAAISGTVAWTGGQFVGSWTLAASQTLNAQSGSDKNFFGTTFVNNGRLNWNTAERVGFVSSSFVNNGTFDLKADANLSYAGGSASSFTNNGTLRKSDGTGSSTIGNAVNFSNPGTIEALSGTLVLPANFNNAGFIKGNATVQTTLLINAGHVAPGTSPGVLTLAGNFQQTSSGTLDIEIASTSVFDTLIVNGNAQLGGTLALQCIGACAIATGNSFVVLDATGDLTGTFATVTTSGFGAGFAYTLQYDTTNDLVRVNVTNAGIPPIPEPHTWALLIAGLGLVTTLARRRATRR